MRFHRQIPGIDPATPSFYLPRLVPGCHHRHLVAVFAHQHLHPLGDCRGDAGGNSENGFGNAALCLCFGLTPPKKGQQAGGAGRGEAASPPGAAGKASAGSTRSLTAETRTVQGGEKTKPSRCSSPSPTPTQATPGFEPSSLGKRGGKMKGSQAPGLSYPTGSYHPQWLLTTAVPF